MLEKLKYRNHLNEVFDFGTDGVYVNMSDLRDYEWTATEKNNRITALDRKPGKRTLPIVIVCNSNAEGIAARNKIFEVVEKDVLAMKHGAIIIGDYYFKCFVTGSKKRDYLRTGRHMKLDLTLTTDFPYWVKETTIPLEKGAEGEEEPVEFEQVTTTGTTVTAYGTNPNVAPMLTVYGLTTQAGTGDPSPTNVRQISGVGVYDACVVLDGTETWTYASTNRAYIYLTGAQLPSNNEMAAAIQTSALPVFAAGVLSTNALPGVGLNNAGMMTVRINNTFTTAQEFADYFAANPLTIWYQKATHTEGDPYYTGVSVEDADGYHGTALPLAQPLYTGDTVESNVVSEYDKCVVLDGTEDWYTNTRTGGVNLRYCLRGFEASAPATNDDRADIACSHYPTQAAGMGYNFCVGAGCVSVNVDGRLIFDALRIATLDEWKAYLAAEYAAGTPVTVYYKSTENGAPLRLYKEVHTQKELVLDGTETWYDYKSEYNTETYFGFQTNLKAIPYSDADYKNQFCSHLAFGQATSGGYFPNTFRVHAVNGIIYVRVEIDGVTSADTWKAYLAAQYAAGTPVTIVYELATPEVYAHEAVALSLPVGESTFSAGGANMELTYYKGEVAFYDYPFDYAATKQAESIVNTHFANSNFRMIIHGEVSNPGVYIGGHLYQVNCYVAQGEYLTIDTVAKTIVLTQQDGTTVNHFKDRNKASYIFKPISPGANSVVFVTEMTIEIVLLEERSEPKWT